MKNVLDEIFALQLHDVTKCYRLYPSPLHRLKEIAFRRSYHSDFTALENISLTVKQGETFGIIGPNGAGKSTLLKIIANTLRPTSGEIRRNGRIAALLELGAGFNPELTGEENIFLTAYLMGLTKAEIESKKREIIEFSELDDFISRPVKTYSSGMHVRLAFSIATSVNPDILIIDEALAVGDQHFQKKSVDRLVEFKKGGKTIVFCSHSLYLVQELCNRTMWLHGGRVQRIGETSKVLNAYNDWVREKDAGMKVSGRDSAGPGAETRDKLVWIESLGIADEEGHKLESMRTGQDVRLTLCLGVTDSARRYQGHIGIGLSRNDDEAIYGVSTRMDGHPPLVFYNGQELGVNFPSMPLLAGQYSFLVVVTDEHALHPYDIRRTEMFSVENFQGELGMVKLAHEWKLSS